MPESPLDGSRELALVVAMTDDEAPLLDVMVNHLALAGAFERHGGTNVVPCVLRGDG